MFSIRRRVVEISSRRIVVGATIAGILWGLFKCTTKNGVIVQRLVSSSPYLLTARPFLEYFSRNVALDWVLVVVLAVLIAKSVCCQLGNSRGQVGECDTGMCGRSHGKLLNFLGAVSRADMVFAKWQCQASWLKVRLVRLVGNDFHSLTSNIKLNTTSSKLHSSSVTSLAWWTCSQSDLSHSEALICRFAHGCMPCSTAGNLLFVTHVETDKGHHIDLFIQYFQTFQSCN